MQLDWNATIESGNPVIYRQQDFHRGTHEAMVVVLHDRFWDAKFIRGSNEYIMNQ